jgi:predicted nuclease of predicted toxin-antitoxin system
MRFLIDEAQHLARVGKAGWKDWNVARYAVEGGFVLVTNNAGDFRNLYANKPLHAGLIIIIPNVNRAAQQQLFRAVLDELAGFGEPVNHVLEVDIEGGEARFAFYTLSAADNG